MKLSSTHRYAIGALLTLFLGVWAYYFFPPMMKQGARMNDEKNIASTTSPVSPEAGFSPLISKPYGFGLMYPSKYYVSAVEVDATSTNPHLAVVMILDTQEHRDILDGKVPAPREGPNGITINAYHNPDGVTPEAWAIHDTNWGVSDKKIATSTLLGEVGVLFRWSGLYEGASLVLPHGEFMYVFAVSWQSEQDPILRDFDALLQTLRFSDTPTSN